MSLLNKKAAVAALALGLFAAPAFAQDLSPVGTWQSTTGESRYKVSLCGDGTQLCAKLTWLRSDARTEENLQYLNKFVVRGAQAIKDNTWKGAVTYNGETVSGSVTLVSDELMQLKGCKLAFCQSVKFVRI